VTTVSERLAGASAASCLDTELLAAYVDGVVDAHERETVEAHLSQCEDCLEIVMGVSSSLRAVAPAAEADGVPPAAGQREDPAERPVHTDARPAHPGSESRRHAAPLPRNWTRRGVAAGLAGTLALAASLLLVVRVYGPGAGLSRDLASLAAVAHAQGHRFTDPRIAGGFSYAPPPPVTRGTAFGRSEVPPDVAVIVARLEQRHRESDSPSTAAAFGVARIVLGDYDRAIELLEEAVRRAPGNAGFHNDLGAAYLARARWRNAPEDWRRGRDAVERALELDASLLEARFNRALAYEGLQDTFRAHSAWWEYQRRDPDSEWSQEVTARLLRQRGPTEPEVLTDGRPPQQEP
jgi:hypothetical protein